MDALRRAGPRNSAGGRRRWRPPLLSSLLLMAVAASLTSAGGASPLESRASDGARPLAGSLRAQVPLTAGFRRVGYCAEAAFFFESRAPLSGALLVQGPAVHASPSMLRFANGTTGPAKTLVCPRGGQSGLLAVKATPFTRWRGLLASYYTFVGSGDMTLPFNDTARWTPLSVTGRTASARLDSPIQHSGSDLWFYGSTSNVGVSLVGYALVDAATSSTIRITVNSGVSCTLTLGSESFTVTAPNGQVFNMSPLLTAANVSVEVSLMMPAPSQFLVEVSLDSSEYSPLRFWGQTSASLDTINEVSAAVELHDTAVLFNGFASLPPGTKLCQQSMHRLSFVNVFSRSTLSCVGTDSLSCASTEVHLDPGAPLSNYVDVVWSPTVQEASSVPRNVTLGSSGLSSACASQLGALSTLFAPLAHYEGVDWQALELSDPRWQDMGQSVDQSCEYPARIGISGRRLQAFLHLPPLTSTIVLEISPATATGRVIVNGVEKPLPGASAGRVSFQRMGPGLDDVLIDAIIASGETMSVKYEDQSATPFVMRTLSTNSVEFFITGDPSCGFHSQLSNNYDPIGTYFEASNVTVLAASDLTEGSIMTVEYSTTCLSFRMPESVARLELRPAGLGSNASYADWDDTSPRLMTFQLGCLPSSGAPSLPTTFALWSIVNGAENMLIPDLRLKARQVSVSPLRDDVLWVGYPENLTVSLTCPPAQTLTICVTLSPAERFKPVTPLLIMTEGEYPIEIVPLFSTNQPDQPVTANFALSGDPVYSASPPAPYSFMLRYSPLSLVVVTSSPFSLTDEEPRSVQLHLGRVPISDVLAQFVSCPAYLACGNATFSPLNYAVDQPLTLSFQDSVPDVVPPSVWLSIAVSSEDPLFSALEPIVILLYLTYSIPGLTEEVAITSQVEGDAVQHTLSLVGNPVQPVFVAWSCDLATSVVTTCRLTKDARSCVVEFQTVSDQSMTNPFTYRCNYTLLSPDARFNFLNLSTVHTLPNTNLVNVSFDTSGIGSSLVLGESVPLVMTLSTYPSSPMEVLLACSAMDCPSFQFGPSDRGPQTRQLLVKVSLGGIETLNYSCVTLDPEYARLSGIVLSVSISSAGVHWRNSLAVVVPEGGWGEARLELTGTPTSDVSVSLSAAGSALTFWSADEVAPVQLTSVLFTLSSPVRSLLVRLHATDNLAFAGPSTEAIVSMNVSSTDVVFARVKPFPMPVTVEENDAAELAVDVSGVPRPLQDGAGGNVYLRLSAPAAVRVSAQCPSELRCGTVDFSSSREGILTLFFPPQPLPLPVARRRIYFVVQSDSASLLSLQVRPLDVLLVTLGGGLSVSAWPTGPLLEGASATVQLSLQRAPSSPVQLHADCGVLSCSPVDQEISVAEFASNYSLVVLFVGSPSVLVRRLEVVRLSMLSSDGRYNGSWIEKSVELIPAGAGRLEFRAHFGSSLSWGSSGTLDVRLRPRPLSDVMLRVHSRGLLVSKNWEEVSELLVTPESWEEWHSLELRPLVSGSSVWVEFEAISTSALFVFADRLSVDVPAAGLLVADALGLLSLPRDGLDPLTVSLRPRLRPLSRTEFSLSVVGLPAPMAVSVSPASLFFGPSDWETEQSATLSCTSGCGMCTAAAVTGFVNVSSPDGRSTLMPLTMSRSVESSLVLSSLMIQVPSSISLSLSRPPRTSVQATVSSEGFTVSPAMVTFLDTNYAVPVPVTVSLASSPPLAPEFHESVLEVALPSLGFDCDPPSGWKYQLRGYATPTGAPVGAAPVVSSAELVGSVLTVRFASSVAVPLASGAFRSLHSWSPVNCSALLSASSCALMGCASSSVCELNAESTELRMELDCRRSLLRAGSELRFSSGAVLSDSGASPSPFGSVTPFKVSSGAPSAVYSSSLSTDGRSVTLVSSSELILSPSVSLSADGSFDCHSVLQGTSAGSGCVGRLSPGSPGRVVFSLGRDYSLRPTTQSSGCPVEESLLFASNGLLEASGHPLSVACVRVARPSTPPSVSTVVRGQSRVSSGAAFAEFYAGYSSVSGAAPLEFRWSVSPEPPGLTSLLASASSPWLRLPTDQLTPGQTYTVTAHLWHFLSSSETTATASLVVESVGYPRVVLDLPGRVTLDQREPLALTVRSFLSLSDPRSKQNLSSVAGVMVTWSYGSGSSLPAGVTVTNGGGTLLVPAGLLAPLPATHEFSVAASLSGVEFLAQSVRVEVSGGPLAAVPSWGWLEALPFEGEAQSTEFCLRAAGFGEDASCLAPRFRFGYVRDGVQSWLCGDFSIDPKCDSPLPQGLGASRELQLSLGVRCASGSEWSMVASRVGAPVVVSSRSTMQTTEEFLQLSSTLQLEMTTPGASGQEWLLLAVGAVTLLPDQCPFLVCGAGECVQGSCQCRAGFRGTHCNERVPVSGGWSSWVAGTCVGGGEARHRSCTNPAPLYGGDACVGSAVSLVECGGSGGAMDPLPRWSAWGQWGACSVSCNGSTSTATSPSTPPQTLGERVRERACVVQPGSSQTCEGPARETEECWEACPAMQALCPGELRVSLTGEVVGLACSGHGACRRSSSGCDPRSSGCFATCECFEGYFGQMCSLPERELSAVSQSASALLNTTLSVPGAGLPGDIMSALSGLGAFGDLLTSDVRSTIFKVMVESGYSNMSASEVSSLLDLISAELDRIFAGEGFPSASELSRLVAMVDVCVDSLRKLSAPGEMISMTSSAISITTLRSAPIGHDERLRTGESELVLSWTAADVDPEVELFTSCVEWSQSLYPSAAGLALSRQFSVRLAHQSDGSLVSELPKPLYFVQRVPSGPSLSDAICGFIDPATGNLSTRGLLTMSLTMNADGSASLLCATTHLTDFMLYSDSLLPEMNVVDPIGDAMLLASYNESNMVVPIVLGLTLLLFFLMWLYYRRKDRAEQSDLLVLRYLNYVHHGQIEIPTKALTGEFDLPKTLDAPRSRSGSLILLSESDELPTTAEARPAEPLFSPRSSVILMEDSAAPPSTPPSTDKTPESGLTSFWGRFKSELSDEHSWVSMLSRNHDNFLVVTRAQRVVVLLAAVLTDFCVMALFFGNGSSTFGQAMMTSILSALIMIPVSLILPWLFHYANSISSHSSRGRYYHSKDLRQLEDKRSFYLRGTLSALALFIALSSLAIFVPVVMYLEISSFTLLIGIAIAIHLGAAVYAVWVRTTTRSVHFVNLAVLSGVGLLFYLTAIVLFSLPPSAYSSAWHQGQSNGMLGGFCSEIELLLRCAGFESPADAPYHDIRELPFAILDTVPGCLSAMESTVSLARSVVLPYSIVYLAVLSTMLVVCVLMSYQVERVFNEFGLDAQSMSALIVLQRWTQRLRSRRFGPRRQEFRYWMKQYRYRSVLIDVVYCLCLLYIVFMTYVNLIYGVKFSPGQSASWITGCVISLVIDIVLQQVMSSSFLGEFFSFFIPDIEC